MRPAIAFLATVVPLAAQSSTQTSLADPPPSGDSVVLITLGLTDSEPADWSGSIQVEAGNLLALVGREFRVGDVVHPPNRWEAWSRPGMVIAKRLMYAQYFSTPDELRILEPSLYAFLESSAATRVRVDTVQGGFEFRISALDVGATKTYLGGRASVQRTVHPRLLGRGASADDRLRRTDNDFPAVAVGSDGSPWISWQAYTGTGDDVYVRHGDGRLSVVRRDADVYRTDLALDGDGRAWVVWAERLNDNWDLFGRAFDGESWSAVERLTEAPQPDLQHRMAPAPDGSLQLVWQAYRGGVGRIFHRSYSPLAGWSEPASVSGDGGNCWEPAVAATSEGVFVAWDQYGESGYDVNLRPRVGGEWRDVTPIAATARFEAHVTLAADPAGRVWLAWDEAGANWGKDFGYPRDITLPGEGLYQRRRIGMAVWQDGELLTPEVGLADSLPADTHNFYELPELAADGSGRVWAFFRHRTNYEVNNPARVPSHYALWETYASHYAGETWSPLMLLPYSTGNNDSRIRAVPDGEGGVIAVWPTDRRNFRDFDTLQPDVFLARLPAASTGARAPRLRPYLPEPADRTVVHSDEAGDVARVRTYEYAIDGARF